MSEPKYSPQIASALATLLRKGQAMTLFHIGVPSYDPVNPSASSPTILQTTPCVGVVLPASQGTIEAFDKRILDDPLQRRDFRFVMLAGATPAGALLPFEPQALDILRTAEGNYRLLGATGLNPAGDGAILWNLGCTLDTQIDLDALITLDSTGDVEWEIVEQTPDADEPLLAIEDSETIDWQTPT